MYSKKRVVEALIIEDDPIDIKPLILLRQELMYKFNFKT